MPKSWIDNTKNVKFFNSKPKMMTFSNFSIEKDELKETLNEPLALWALLYDIPLHYLIPDPTVLPDESIRFFYLDQNWIRSLLDGALSIGRDLRVDYEHDLNYIEEIYTNALSYSSTIRSRLQNKEIKDPGYYDGLYSGFILNSALVSGFRGLEFVASDVNNKVLEAVRIETLTPQILVGIFIGEVHSLVIHEPKEGLSHQVLSDNNQRYLRVRAKDSAKEIQPFKKVNIETNNRVINYAKLAKELNCSNSSELAMQILKLPSVAIFTNEGGNS